MRRFVLLLGMTLTIGATACSTSSATSPNPAAFDAITFAHGPRNWLLHVAVADTDAERARGLMGVTHLPADRGMAFVFSAPTTATFWMKDTLIPLSIAFVRDGRILTLHQMTPCTTDPCPTYGTDGVPFTLAIEANAGYFRSKGITTGDRVGTETADG